MNNIYLIGMPGCGKTTIGKIVSDDLGINFIDTDQYLEQKFNQTIPHIFETKGEEDFRQKETAVLKELSNKDNVVISTGGGVVKKNINKDIMKQSGTIIFIDSLPDTILSNSHLDGRPLLKDKSRIYELYNERINLYRDFSDIIIDNNGILDNAVESLKKAIKKE